MEEVNNYKSSPSLQEKRSNTLAIIATTIGGVALIGCIVLTVWNVKLNAQIVALQMQDSTIKKSTDSLVKKQATYEKEQLRIKTIAYLSYMSHEVENTAVTDDFVVTKISFTPTSSGELSGVTIDMDNQPQMALNYNGEGNYDIADRQLRTKVTKLVTSAKDYYGGDPNAPAWADSTPVKVTVKNYDVGDYTSGEFKLTGEK